MIKLCACLLLLLAITLSMATNCSSAAEAKKTNDVPVAATNKGYKDVNVEQFDKLRGNTNNVVLDVRTAEEYAAGHIPGSANADINSPDFEKRVAQLDKNKTYLVHCAAGSRSARACSKLSKLSFNNCYNLVGGMHAWEKAGKPVEK